MSDQQKTYNLTLKEFRDYLREKATELRECYRETEEIQYQFNDIFKRELKAWQEDFGYCFPRVLAQRHDLPESLASRIDQAEQEELVKLREEAAALLTTIEQNKLQSDTLLRQAQEAAAALKRANPELNNREEALKAQLTARQDEYAAAYEQIEALERGIGWLVNGVKISKLKNKQKSAKEAQARLLMELRETRKAWQQNLEKVGQTQSELRQQWESLGIATSQAQARLDFIRANESDLAQQQAITRVLSDLDASPGVEGELGEVLDRLVERNKVRRSYEEGLRSVAEALGLTKGVAEGVERFAKSVEGVVEEQVRYSLADVKVSLPQWVINVIETWKPLRERVKDEKYLGANPLEFSGIIKSYISDRLTDDIIKRFFESMGEALNTATKAWN